MAARDMSPEAVKLRLAKLYGDGLESKDYFEKEEKIAKPSWKEPEKKYPLKIKGADKTIKEAQVKEQIDEYIKEHKLFHKRISTQGILMVTGENTAKMTTNPMVGMSDLYFNIQGISVWAELKKPTGAYTQGQLNFITDIIKCGGVAGIVTNIPDLERLFHEARTLRKRPYSTVEQKQRLLKVALSPQDYTL